MDRRTSAFRRAKQPDAMDVRIGALVRMLRVNRGLSQTALATPLGITFQQVQKYETGKNRIGSGRLCKIADLLGVNVSSFFEKAANGGAEELSSEIVNMMGKPQFVRMVRAFAAIESPSVRSAIADLVCATAKTMGRG